MYARSSNSNKLGIRKFISTRNNLKKGKLNKQNSLGRTLNDFVITLKNT